MVNDRSSVDSKAHIDAFGARKARLLEMARRLKAAAEDRKDQDSCSVLERFVRRFDENKFLVVFAGEFKRGKSTLVNALVAREICPVHVTPRTARVTRIHAAIDGREAVDIHFIKEREVERLPLAGTDLGDLVARGGRREGEVSEVDVFVEARTDLMRSGLVLVDTPGLESLFKEHDKITKEYLPRADLVVFCLSATQTLSARERDFLRSYNHQLKDKLVVTLNHIDTVPDTEKVETIEFVKSSLRDEVFGSAGAVPELFPLSGRRALEAGVDVAARVATGVPALEQAVIRKLTVDRGRSILRAIAEGEREVALGLAKQYAAAREVCVTAVGADLRADCARLSVEAQTRCAQLQKVVGREIEESAEDLAAKAVGRVAVWRQQLKVDVRQLITRFRNEQECRRLLPAQLANHLEGWLLEYEQTLRERFERVSQQATARCNQEFRELEQRAAEVLAPGKAKPALVQVATVDALARLGAVAGCIGGPVGGYGLALQAIAPAFEVPEAVRVLTVAAGVGSFLAAIGGPIGWGVAVLGWVAVAVAKLVRSSSWQQRVVKQLDAAVDNEIAPRAEGAITTEVWTFARALQDYISEHVNSVEGRFLEVVRKLDGQVTADRAAVIAEAERYVTVERELAAIAAEIGRFITEVDAVAGAAPPEAGP